MEASAQTELEALRRRVAELENELRGMRNGKDLPWAGVPLRLNGRASSQNEEQSRLSLALSVAQLGTFEWNVKTGRVTLDERSREIFGFAPGEGTTAGEIFDRIHPEDLDRVFAEAQASQEQLSRLDTEYRIVLPGRPVRTIVSISYLTVGAGGKAERMFGVFSDITERKRIEEALRESEQESGRLKIERDTQLDIFDTVLAQLQEFVYLLDPEGRFRYVNQPLLDLWGLTLEQAIGKDFFDLGYPDELARLHQKQIRRVVETGRPVDGENSYTSPAGLTGYYEYTFVPLFAPDGSVESVGGHTHDITERKRAGAALKASEEKYRTLFESMDQGFCIVQMLFNEQQRPVDYIFIEVNRVFEQQTGLRNAAGRTVRELVPDLEPFWFETYGAVALTGVPTRFVNHSEPLGRWFDVNAFRIGAPEQRHVALLFKDITDRKHAEAERERLLQQIEDERQRLRQVFLQAPVAIVVFRGRDFVVELANPPYEAMVQGRELVGRRFADVVPELGQHVWDAFHRVMDTGEPFVANDLFVAYDQDGDGVIEDHWFSVAYHPLREADGTISGFVAVSSEITVQVLARRELERVNRELEEFAYVASHDLQEPLRMVNIYTQLLIKDFVAHEPEAQQYAGLVQQGVTRMQVLIRDLLNYSRTVQKAELPVGSADLAEALSDAMSILKIRIEENAAAITAGPLPMVRGETLQMSHVFQNLISNALKYRKSGAPPEIAICARQDADGFLISVQDNGIGFEQQYRREDLWLVQAFT